MKKMSLIGLIIGLATIYSCKKQNEDLIEGSWNYQNMYINEVASTTVYGVLDSCYLPDSVGSSVGFNYHRRFEIKELSWEFSEGDFKKYETGDSLRACNESSYLPLNTNHSNNAEGTYNVSDDGEGNVLILTFDDGTILDVNIDFLDKENLTVRYQIDTNNFKVDFVKIN